MARYFAEIGPDNEVTRVVVAEDPAWLATTLGGTWTETLIEQPTLEQYAGIGMHYTQGIAPLGFVPEWVQPEGAHDAYPNSVWVWHNGVTWRSLQDANVFEPGVASWRENSSEWPPWVQPTGAQDAYQTGEKISWEGGHYVSTMDANVWNPATLPSGWELQP